MRGAAAALGRRRLVRPALTLRTPSRRLRLRLLALAVLSLTLAAGYQFWLRDSSLVSVDDVQVSGLTTKDSERVRAALTSAAQTMTTLNVEERLLEEAVAHHPVVRGLEVSADFPHGLRIRVLEHHPAALVAVGDDRVPVAGDGTLLRGLPDEGRLPVLDMDLRPGGERLQSAVGLHAARVAGAAPGPLRSRIESISVRKQEGIVARLHDGPELFFGDGTRVEAKWIAATRVLADRQAEGATYVDVRLPGRPAAGGLPATTVTPVAPAGVAATPGVGVTGAGAATTDPSQGTGAAAVAPPTQSAPVGAQPAPETAGGTMPATPSTGAPAAAAAATPTVPLAPTAPPTGVAGGVGAPPG